MPEQEQHHPSTEEMQPAEAMTPVEAKASQIRAWGHGDLKREYGVTPDLLKETFLTRMHPYADATKARQQRDLGITHEMGLEGQVKGHAVQLLELQYGQPPAGRYSYAGTVDGIRIAPEEAERLYKKYRAIQEFFERDIMQDAEAMVTTDNEREEEERKKREWDDRQQEARRVAREDL